MLANSLPLAAITPCSGESIILDYFRNPSLLEFSGLTSRRCITMSSLTAIRVTGYKVDNTIH